MPQFLPRSVLRPAVARHIGFLNYNRRVLGIGAIAASTLLASIPSLPAGAEVVLLEAKVSSLQSFVVPATVVGESIARDGFTVSTFTLVQWPVPASTTMSSGFGSRDCAGCPTFHKGDDLNPGDGYPVQAVADGVVTETGNSLTDLGVYVVVKHVVDGATVSSQYAHMQFGSMSLAVGDPVRRGQQLGLVGSTGQSTGPHLHFGIFVDGVAIDPRPWLLAHANS